MPEENGDIRQALSTGTSSINSQAKPRQIGIDSSDKRVNEHTVPIGESTLGDMRKNEVADLVGKAVTGNFDMSFPDLALEKTRERIFT